jgi:hypothetical protein
VKKFKKIKFNRSNQWRLLNPQNQTLLFAADIKGYFCKEHKIGFSRIQSVISHYFHKHDGKKLDAKIEYDDTAESLTKNRNLSKSKIAEREKQRYISAIFKKLEPDHLSHSELAKKISITDQQKDNRWWEKRNEEDIENQIKNYEILERAKKANMPEEKLHEIKLKLGINLLKEYDDEKSYDRRLLDIVFATEYKNEKDPDKRIELIWKYTEARNSLN